VAYNPFDLAFSNEAAMRLAAAGTAFHDFLFGKAPPPLGRTEIFDAAAARTALYTQQAQQRTAAAGGVDFSSVHNPADLVDTLHGLLSAFATGPTATEPASAARGAVTRGGSRVLPRGYMGPRPSPVEPLNPLALGLGPAWDREPGLQTGEGLPPSIATPGADPNVRFIPGKLNPETGIRERDPATAQFMLALRQGKYNSIFSPEELTALSQQLEPNTRPPRPDALKDVPIPNERRVPRPDDLFGTREDRPGLHELELGTSYATYRKQGLAVLQSIQRDLEAGKISPAMASARAKTVHEGLNELPTQQGAAATRETFPVEWLKTAPTNPNVKGRPYPNFNPIGSHTLSPQEMAAHGWNPPPGATGTGRTARFLARRGLGMLATQNTDPNFPTNFRVYEPRANASRYFDRPLDLEFPETQRRISTAGGFKNMLQLDQPIPAQFGPGLLDIRGPSGERVLVGQRIDIGTAPASHVARALSLTPEGLRAKLGLAGIIDRAPNGRRFARFPVSLAGPQSVVPDKLAQTNEPWMAEHLGGVLLEAINLRKTDPEFAQYMGDMPTSLGTKELRTLQVRLRDWKKMKAADRNQDAANKAMRDYNPYE